MTTTMIEFQCARVMNSWIAKVHKIAQANTKCELTIATVYVNT